MSVAGFDFDSCNLHIYAVLVRLIFVESKKKIEKADTMQLNQTSFVQSLNSWFRNATSGEAGRREGKCK